MKVSRKLILLVVPAMAALMLGACQGRKMSNMEPTGDTVEVVINQPDTATSSDSI